MASNSADNFGNMAAASSESSVNMVVPDLHNMAAALSGSSVNMIGPEIVNGDEIGVGVEVEAGVPNQIDELIAQIGQLRDSTVGLRDFVAGEMEGLRVENRENTAEIVKMKEKLNDTLSLMLEGGLRKGSLDGRGDDGKGKRPKPDDENV